nr:MAG TPA: hypothetical protein [Bacteriophage sp.]
MTKWHRFLFQGRVQRLFGSPPPDSRRHIPILCRYTARNGSIR